MNQPIVHSPFWFLAAVGLAAALFSVFMWGWLGPFAGMLWSMFCVFLGAMIEAVRQHHLRSDGK